ncbi:MAG: RecX family transcriptional regulator [Candidatus Sumerlaeota bacterium]|nr:RecX family transcriptional regulator [Candidatus Sumerlaeota bacterium]
MRLVTAIRPLKRRKTDLEIDLDGETWRVVDAEVVVRFGLKTGDALDEEAICRIEAEDAFVRARRMAVNFSVRQPRTEKEILRRLGQGRFDAATISRALDTLRAEGLLEDRRVVRRQEARGAKSKTGPRRVEAELAARGVSAELLSDELQSLRDPRWQAREAEALARKRLERLGNRPLQEQRRKVSDYLLRRGFDPEIVREVVDRLRGGENPSEGAI